MLLKGKTYRKDNKTFEVIDYYYYKGSKAHGFTFKVGTELVKEEVREADLQKYLATFDEFKGIKIELETKIETAKQEAKVMEQKKDLEQIKDLLLETMKEVKANKLSSDKANAISKGAQTYLNVLITETKLKS